MTTLANPRVQYVDGDGVPYAFAKMYLFLTGTTTPVEAYTDVDMTSPLPHPIVADSNGLFPTIIYDGTERVRMVVTDADGDLGSPLIDADPVNDLFTVGAGNLGDGAIEEKLGYDPVNPANAIFTGPIARLTFTGGYTANVDDVGFRGSPISVKNVDYAFAKDESGYTIVKDGTNSPTYTINADIVPIGHWFGISVDNVGELNLERGAGVSLRSEGSLVDEDLILPEGYKGRIHQTGANEWVLEPAANPGIDLSVNGYVRFPGGYIRQWGKYTGNKSGDTTQVVNFPIAFPNGVLGGSVTVFDSAFASTADMAGCIQALSNTQLTAYISGPSGESVDGFYWEAWGH